MNRPAWLAINNGMLRGRWRTSYQCRACGHRVSDTDPSWKQLIDVHERAHAGQDDLFGEKTA